MLCDLDSLWFKKYTLAFTVGQPIMDLVKNTLCIFFCIKIHCGVRH